jgi:hypothetical protein
MTNSYPVFISILFILTTILTLLFVYRILKNSTAGKKIKLVMLFLISWLLIQAVISIRGFYFENTLTVPPRFTLTIIPPVITIVYLFLSKRCRAFINSLSFFDLAILSIVRIPVEVVLYLLYLNQGVPELMTFAGRNFDILAGISAPIIALAYKRNIAGKNLLLAWNIISLLLLLNIVINAILSAPFFFQRFAFDQPNIAILYFPFSWLPAFIVPAVLFTHLASIQKLLNKRNANYLPNPVT